MDLTEKTLESREVYRGRILRVREDRVLLPNGQEAQREIVEHPGGVGILALDADGCAVMVRQYRYAFGQTLLEPDTVTCQTPDGSERRIFTQDELRGGCVPLLPGESADYTVAARLQGEDGSTYDAVFCFRYDRLAGET